MASSAAVSRDSRPTAARVPPAGSAAWRFGSLLTLLLLAFSVFLATQVQGGGEKREDVGLALVGDGAELLESEEDAAEAGVCAGLVQQGGGRVSKELVIARYAEDLAWISRVPPEYDLTIVNKGAPLTISLPPRTRIMTMPNSQHGKESESYARFISERYDSLADYTFFSQGDPFPHSHGFIELLQEAPVNGYRGLSRAFSAVVPPPNLLPPGYDPRDQPFNMYTLNTIEWDDRDIIYAYDIYRTHYELLRGTHVIDHWFNTIGLDQWLPSGQVVGEFTYGAIFSVSSEHIKRHPRAVYERLETEVLRDFSVGYVAERSWKLLLG